MGLVCGLLLFRSIRQINYGSEMRELPTPQVAVSAHRFLPVPSSTPSSSLCVSHIRWCLFHFSSISCCVYSFWCMRSCFVCLFVCLLMTL